jgi:hypothetical protein
MRVWLRNPTNATLPTWDFMSRFMGAFQLTPQQCGQLIAQYIREHC